MPQTKSIGRTANSINDSKEPVYRRNRPHEHQPLLTEEYLETVKALASAGRQFSKDAAITSSFEEELDAAVRWLYPDQHDLDGIKQLLDQGEKAALIKSWKQTYNQSEVEEALLWIYPEIPAEVTT